MEYTNLQKVFLELFRYELPEQQLIEIKHLVQSYLINNIDQSVNMLFEKNNISSYEIEDWLKEDFRINK